MLRDVFYYGKKPNVHPREQYAKNLAEARKKATTEHFWIVNEFCDYIDFDWDFDFEFLPDEDVWAEKHNNVWPSVHQKDSGTWLCAKQRSDVIVYRADVNPLKRKVNLDNWKILENIDKDKWDFSWHPDPTDPPFVYKWGSKYAPAELKTCLEYHVEGATQVKYMSGIVELLPNYDCLVEVQKVDSSKWDMSWRPDPMDSPYIYVWGNKYIDGRLRATLEYRVPGATEKKYMPELVPVVPEWDRWKILHDIDKSSFDFAWRPDPREPNFVYVFGNEQYDGTIMPTVEYHMPETSTKKYVENTVAKLCPQPEKFQHLEKSYGIDYSWVPDPTSPPYIYAWGNQWNKPEDKISIQYVVEGATEYKYMAERAIRKPCMDNWVIPDHLDVSLFDFSWEPSPADPPYIYEFGTQWQKTGGPKYVVEGATETKYIEFQKAKALPTKSNWTIPANLDITGFDFSWHPDATSPPYTYHFATQWALTGGPIYKVEGATEIKYLDNPSAIALPNKTNWEYDSNLIDEESFDFSWHPYVEDQPYIYQFGTQHQKTGGPRYVTPGALSTSPIKYIDTRILKAKRLSNNQNFATLNNYKIKNFDYSWHPDDTEEPYIYVFGNNLHSAEIMPTIEYATQGATKIKYVHDVVAELDVDMSNWEVPDDVDTIGFDFSWKPNPKDPAYVYQFGTQWQKTGGPKYVVPGANEVKFVSTQIVKKLPNKERFAILNNYQIDSFDYSWHPDDTEQPYIYVFGNNLYPAEIMPTIEYVVADATQIKYISDIKATLAIDKTNWQIPENIDVSNFDFTWKPNPKDPAYIYQFGTQHQKTGGPKYVVPNASHVKYIDEPKANSLPNRDNFGILDNLLIDEFDFTWHPDDTEEPYIYVFGNTQYPAEIMPTVEYATPGASKVKYVHTVKAKLAEDKKNWDIPKNINVETFDFSWKPNPKDPAYIYEFGTQWQKTGGPRYIVPGATETKYVDTQKAIALVNMSNWAVPEFLNVSEFDFSWHPDSTSPPYIYHFATQWALTGGPIYKVEGATEVKYLDYPCAVALPNRTNWQIPEDINVDAFDFSWHPYVEDQPYVYVFGTQHQKTGGPKYITPGVIPTSPVKYIDTRILKAQKLTNKDNFAILNNYKIKDFDWSWHPDDTEEPYIYVFGNTQYPAEIMPTIEYAMPGATKVKYVNTIQATLDIDYSNWSIPENIDVSNFDFTWKPNPKDPAYIYQFGTQHQKTGGPRYSVPGATEVKYVDTMKAIAIPRKDMFAILNNYKIKDFDYSWHPDETEEGYIYVFGNNQYTAEIMPTIEYSMPGVTKIKYVNTIKATLDVDYTNWVTPNDIEIVDFDFSWKPNPKDPAYIYQFGTQHQKTGGPKYIVPEAAEVKYVDTMKVTKIANKDNFAILNNYKIKDFDYSWHPDDTEEPYIYVFGNNQYPAEIMPTIEYNMVGSKQVKYVGSVLATLDVDTSNWEIPEDVDTTDFDFSWKPNPKDPAYIYEFGTQWQKTGGPRYVIEGATETKYVDTMKVKKLPSNKNWVISSHIDITDFDFSWHPDNTDPLYIYQFGTQWALSGGPKYVMPGATEIKYIDSMVARALPNKQNWEVPDYIDATDFDFSWHPYAEDDPYVYQFGTQHQKTGGVRYLTPGVLPTSAIKYIDTRIIKSKRKEDKSKFSILNNYKIKNFDWSWHPDDTEEPYIYVFGNNQYPAEIMPTIEYVVPGAKQIKYVNEITATLDVDLTNWEIPEDIDTTGFDFSWKPNPKDPAYIYEFGTQWQKTGGPKYVVPEATEVKYVTTQQVKKLPNRKKWDLPANVDVTDFDFSWHPDATSPPYIYHFATQWALSGGPIYRMEGATEVKYLEEPCAVALPSKENWETPIDIDSSKFDYSWHPYVEDQPYIYQFGTQWQKTGGPKYITPGSLPTSPIKYIDTRILKAEKLPNRNNFNILNNYKIKNFDWSWHPDDTEEPYIYVFGNNQYPAEIMPTIEYAVPGATKIKYVQEIKAVLDSDKTNWEIPSGIDVSDFDFSWKPNPKDPAYIYEFGTQWQKTGGPRYVVFGATQVKYIDGSKARSLPNKKNWILPKDIPIVSFDYSWHPDTTEDPYIYVFGTQWQLTAGPKYVVEGATEYKYMDVNFAKSGPTDRNWEIPSDIVLQDFDFSWHPHPDDPAFIYEFGTQWYDRGGPRYVPPGSNKDTPIKYIDTRIIRATLGPNTNNWYIPNGISIENFDYSWVPHPNDPPYIYRWGNKYVSNIYKPTIEYRVPGATQTKYMSDDVVVLPEWDRWVIPNSVDKLTFDFSWRPDPLEPDYIWQFGTQWQETGGPRYIIPGAKDIKYVDRNIIQSTRLSSRKNWEIPENIDVTTFDFSWHPDDRADPYIYQFGTLLNRNDGPKYVTPGNKGEIVYLPRVETTKNTYVDEEPIIKPVANIKVNQYFIENTLEDLVKQHTNEVFWALNKNIDYTDFDFNWRPEIINVEWESNYVHVFGSPDAVATHTYFINANSYLSGNKDFKFVDNVKLSDLYLSKLFIKPDMFFVDRGNKESQSRFEKLKEKHGNVQKTRFLNSWVDTIKRCINRSSTELCWILNSELDYSNFNFDYYPNPWQIKMVHIFGTQWNHWGTTFMVNRETFADDTKYIKVIEHLNNLNFVKDRIAHATSVIHDIVYINHGNYDKQLVDQIVQDGKVIIDYDTDYLTTFKKILAKLPEKKEHFIWIVSSVCNYDNFDFTYICDPYARDDLHVFPSDRQKFGDTFLININRLRELVKDMETLKDYDKINYNQTLRTNRLPAPTIVNEFDSHVLGIMQDFDFPYATLITSDNQDITIADDEPMSLWSADSKTIMITSTGGTRIVVPKEAKQYVETQLYDYPYIKTASRLVKSNPLDIVYLSNGEKCAEENYEHLVKITKGLPNRIVRVDGVNGRVRAYHAAAEASNTSWFLTVFAKLKVNAKFDFNWQPDRLQIPKHYMFLARNPVNGLIYGHQGMIAYNKQMTLDNEGQGLDFTLDSPHETIELLSGTAMYNTDEFSTWRTAFREVIKLKKDNTEISLKRLDAWLNKAEGDFAQYSLDGAKHGIEYYDKVKGKTEKLRLSYEWDWLQKQYKKKYK